MSDPTGCPVNPSRQHLFGFIVNDVYECRCGERLPYEDPEREAVMQELLESYGEGADTDIQYLSGLCDLVMERVGRWRRALILISRDMHVRGTRPCPTCKEITRALGEPFGCEVRR